MDKQCLNCQQVYFAKRKSSKYCSDKCRKAANRDTEDEDSVPDVTINQSPVTIRHYMKANRTLCKKCDFEIEPANEWSHSKCWKTQLDIERHYTKENSPPFFYHSSGGGGTGRRSPYPIDDKRSLAYH